MQEPVGLNSDLANRIVTMLESAPLGIGAWKTRVAALEKEHGREVFRSLFFVLTSLDFSPARARTHWNKLLRSWEKLAEREPIDLRVAVLHYFLQVDKRLKNPAMVEIKILQKARDSVVIDELTGVHNFRYFQERLEQELKRVRRYDRGLSLLMIDVDDFKAFNDNNGHLAGNVALRKLARLLKNCVREVDVVSRYGGEEFAVILPATLKPGALIVAEKMRTKIEGSRFEGEKRQPKGRFTVSLGVATVPMDAGGSEELVERADAALYRAKAAGKNRVESYSDERREFTRYGASLQGTLRMLDRVALPVQTENVSEGGFLFVTSQPFTVGSIVQLDLGLPRERQSLECTARVVRVIERDGRYEIGVKILHLEGGDLYRLQKYIAALESKELPRRQRSPVALRATRRKR